MVRLVRSADATSVIILGQRTEHDAIFSLPGMNYRLQARLAPGQACPPAGTMVDAHLHVNAWRIEVVRLGGRYIEPLYGQPRVFQGHISKINRDDNTLVLRCVCPIICHLMQGRSGDFELGQLIKVEALHNVRLELLTPGHAEPVHPVRREPVPPPAGHTPTEGFQGLTDNRTSTAKEHDHGGMQTDNITGQDAPTGEFPIDG